MHCEPIHRAHAIARGTMVVLGDKFHAEVEWWEWALRQDFMRTGVSLRAVLFDHVQWSLTRDRTSGAVRGF